MRKERGAVSNGDAMGNTSVWLHLKHVSNFSNLDLGCLTIMCVNMPQKL